MTISPETPSSMQFTADLQRHFRTDHLLEGLGDRTARGATVTFVSQALKFLIGFSGTVVLARLLTPEDYGLIGMVAVFTGFIAVFKDLGLSAATIQRVEVTHGQVTNLFWVNLTLGAASALISVIAAPALASFYGDSRLVAITEVSATGFLLGGLSVQHEALLRRQMRFSGLAVLEVLSMLGAVTVSVTLAYRGARYWSLVFSQLALATITACGVWMLSGWRPGLPARGSGVRSMLVFGGNLTAFSVINYWARNLDNLLIGRVWGAHQLGLYSRAYQLLLLPIDQVISPITAVAVPALSRLTDSRERYRQAYLRILEKIALLTMPLMAFLIMTSDWVVELVLGPKWLSVSPIFAVLGMSGILQPVASTAGWLFITQGRTRDMFRWGLIGGMLTIISICVGLPWGALGVAASYSLTNLLLLIPLLWWFVARTGPVLMQDFYRTLRLPALIVLTMLPVLLVFRRHLAVFGVRANIAVAAAIAACTTFIVLCVFQEGRAALRDLGKTLLVSLQRRPVHMDS